MRMAVPAVTIGCVTFYLDQHAAYALHRELGEALAEVALLRWVI